MTDPKPAGDHILKPVYVVMGVTGSGKTTIGSLLATRLSVPFHDADDFHPPDNLEKLANDIPLNDADRGPWLDELARCIERWARDKGAVLACSALKHSYRSRFRQAAHSVRFIFLTGDPSVIARRLDKRARDGGHVIQDYDAILDGQFRDLEIPSSALQVEISATPDAIVDEICSKLSIHYP